MAGNLKDLKFFFKRNAPVVQDEEREKPKTDEVIWHGQPDPKHTRSKYDWLFIPMSWLILVIAIFWRVALKDAELPLQLVSYALMLFSLYFLFLRNHFKKKKRKKISYEMTEEDIIIIYTKKKDMSVRYMPIENIRYMAYSMRKDGSGTVYFNFPNDYKDILKLVFANSGIGHFDEHIYVFFELDDLEAFLSFLKTKLNKEIPCDQI